MNGRIAVYAGSFDPITVGHVDIIRRGTLIFDEVIVAIGHNVRKQRTLPLDVRVAVVREVLLDVPRARVDVFEGLLVEYCRRVGACAILRGVRGVTDFEFEQPPGLANREMAPEIETVLLFANPRHAFVSSSLIKEIATHGGDVSAWLPAPADDALRKARDVPRS